jgi:hypothetical protein
MADFYMVEFRISGKDLSPAEITEAMGIQPTRVLQVGERRTASSSFDQATWSYAGAAGEEWTSLEVGLNSLMRELFPKRDLISGFAKRFDACWWCGHFQDSFDGGPRLSPDLLRELADFGIPVALSNYRSADS